MEDDLDNPFDDNDRWGDEASSADKGAVPDAWQIGQAWLNCRLISPEGNDMEMEIPTLSPDQGMQVNILLARLGNNLPVEVRFKDDDGQEHVFTSTPMASHAD